MHTRTYPSQRFADKYLQMIDLETCHATAHLITSYRSGATVDCLPALDLKIFVHGKLQGTSPLHNILLFGQIQYSLVLLIDVDLL